MKNVGVIVAAGLLAAGPVSSQAQPERSYPDKTVRVVVPWAAGGNIDVLTRVVAQRLSQITGTTFLHVPYKGGGPALTGLLSGEASLYWPGIAIAIPHIKTGRLRALGVASKSRSEELPDLPTLSEQLKAPDYDVTSIFAFMVPAGTPRPLIDKLHSGITKVLAFPEVRKTYALLGATSPQLLSPEETLAMLRSESTRWGKVVRAANLGSN